MIIVKSNLIMQTKKKKLQRRSIEYISLSLSIFLSLGQSIHINLIVILCNK